MKVSADDAADATTELFKDTIKNAPKTAPDLGKFYFSVSASTAGALVAFEKLDKLSKTSLMLDFALGVQALAVIVALFLILPNRMRIDREQELLFHYSSALKKLERVSWLWFILWFAGSVVGICHAILL